MLVQRRNWLAWKCRLPLERLFSRLDRMELLEEPELEPVQKGSSPKTLKSECHEERVTIIQVEAKISTLIDRRRSKKSIQHLSA